ncbi:MAG: hypothetical protein A2Z93_00485 [Curvibacter sp. GWA2_64_110]|nr:MAG: hypothetical protein A2Z93_00485 [Curvibacter sp. GWA2_64_110]HCY17098.1 hypothetical protein [Curvibacter sp.]
MKRLVTIAMACMALLMVGCANQIKDKKDFTNFNAAAPRSILVVPSVNKSLDVDAPNYLLTTLTIPLAEKGYYVFPVHTVKTVLEQEGFYEGERIHAQPPEALAKIFGADAVLYVTINRWDAKYAILTTVVTVEFDYKIVSKNGVDIWEAKKTMQYSPDNSNQQGHPLAILIASAISAATTRAAPNYMPLTKQANYQVFMMGPDAIPNGPYAKESDQK